MKRVIILMAILTMCFCLCACVSSTEPIKSSTSTEPQIMTVPETEPLSKEEAVALFRAEVVDMLAKSGNFSATAFSGDETRINFGVAIEGLMTDLYYAKNAGHDENYEKWVEVKNSMLETYDTICDTAKMYGLENTEIYLYILNDSNTSKAILTIRDGAVIGDYMSQ